MARLGPRQRSRLLGVAFVVTIAVAAETGNVQTLFPILGGGYAAAAAAALWTASRRSGEINIDRSDLIVRRWSAWIVLLLVAAYTVLITQAFLRGALAVGLLYVGGVLDGASLPADRGR